jgi:hypothetical protein
MRWLSIRFVHPSSSLHRLPSKNVLVSCNPIQSKQQPASLVQCYGLLWDDAAECVLKCECGGGCTPSLISSSQYRCWLLGVDWCGVGLFMGCSLVTLQKDHQCNL